MKNVPLHVMSGSSRIQKELCESSSSRVNVLGMEFRSRVGLAAGFDKNAEILAGLPALGFGFAEIGTVTPRPQGGNSRPRLFRDPAREALFNRMGFNGLGAEAVSERLRRLRSEDRLPRDFRVGVNVGKNKDTPLADAREDYIKVVGAFQGLADYLVINISSPNTPGLRSLQTVQASQSIVEGVLTVVTQWQKQTPVFIKVAPELAGEELSRFIQTAESWGIDGWVLTNTLGGSFCAANQKWDGGWSGGPLLEYSRKSLDWVRQISQKTIISVGGIGSVEEAVSRLSRGADLIQLYTGWIYRGPTFPVEIAKKLRKTSIDSKTREPQAKA